MDLINLNSVDFDAMPENVLREFHALHKAGEKILSENKILSFFPDTGDLRRELYNKHVDFFNAGNRFRERLFMSANRVGKTIAGAYETTLHLTGDYPHWWTGKRFANQVDWWAAGDTNQTTRDVIQLELLGPPGQFGTGMIPADKIERTVPKPGVPDMCETIYVKHKSGGVSRCGMKSYDQGRKAFQGTAKHGIWLDEESSLNVYSECLLRTMTTNGLIMLTFTPLMGLSEVVLEFLPGGRIEEHSEGSKHVTMATWDDAPHLSDDVKQELWKSIPPYQRDARSKGIPQLGSGAIYPVAEDDLLCEPFEIPEWWPRCYGLDVGWNKTACLWAAYDRDHDTLYITDEYYRGQAEPASHAAAVKSRGDWIPGVIDPAAGASGQADGRQLLAIYQSLGLQVVKANNAVEAGIFETMDRLSTGRLKVFRHLQSFLSEYRVYRRDENGKIVKENDHLMDCMRYLVMSGLSVASTYPYDYDAEYKYQIATDGRSSIGGY